MRPAGKSDGGDNSAGDGGDGGGGDGDGGDDKHGMSMDVEYLMLNAHADAQAVTKMMVMIIVGIIMIICDLLHGGQAVVLA